MQTQQQPNALILLRSTGGDVDLSPEGAVDRSRKTCQVCTQGLALMQVSDMLHESGN